MFLAKCIFILIPQRATAHAAVFLADILYKFHNECLLCKFAHLTVAMLVVGLS